MEFVFYVYFEVFCRLWLLCENLFRFVFFIYGYAFRFSQWELSLGEVQVGCFVLVQFRMLKDFLEVLNIRVGRCQFFGIIDEKFDVQRDKVNCLRIYCQVVIELSFKLEWLGFSLVFFLLELLGKKRYFFLVIYNFFGKL